MSIVSFCRWRQFRCRKKRPLFYILLISSATNYVVGFLFPPLVGADVVSERTLRARLGRRGQEDLFADVVGLDKLDDGGKVLGEGRVVVVVIVAVVAVCGADATGPP